MIFNKKFLKVSLVLSMLLSGEEVLAKDCSTIFCDKANKDTKSILFKPKSFLMFDSNNQFATSVPLDNLKGKSVNYTGQTFNNSVNLYNGTIGNNNNGSSLTFSGIDNQFKDITFNNGKQGGNGGNFIDFGILNSHNTFSNVIFNGSKNYKCRTICSYIKFNGNNTFTNGVTFNDAFATFYSSITFNGSKQNTIAIEDGSLIEFIGANNQFNDTIFNVGKQGSSINFSGASNQFNDTIFNVGKQGGNGDNHITFGDSTHNLNTFNNTTFNIGKQGNSGGNSVWFNGQNTFNNITFNGSYNSECIANKDCGGISFYYDSSIFTNGVTFNDALATFYGSITFNGSKQNTITIEDGSSIYFSGANNQFNDTIFNVGKQGGNGDNNITFGNVNGKSQNDYTNDTFLNYGSSIFYFYGLNNQFSNATFDGNGSYRFFDSGIIAFNGTNTLDNSNSPFGNQNGNNQNTDNITFASNSVLNLNYALTKNTSYSIINTSGTIDYGNLNDLYKLIEVGGIKGSLEKIVSNTLNNNARLAQANSINKTYDVVYDDINGKDIVLKETFTNNSISVKEIASFSSKQTDTKIYNKDSSSAQKDLNTANTDKQANITAQATDKTLAISNPTTVGKDLKQLNTDSQNITNAQQALQQDLSNEQQAIGTSNFDTYHNKIASDEQNLAKAEQTFTNEQNTLQNDVTTAQAKQNQSTNNPHIVSGNGSQEHHNNSNKNTNGGKSHTPSIPTPHNNQSPQPKTTPLSPTPPIPSTHQKDKADNTPIKSDPNKNQSKNQSPSAESTTNHNNGSNSKQSKNANSSPKKNPSSGSTPTHHVISNPTSNPNPTTPTKIAINGTTITLAPNSFKINQTTTSFLQLQNNLSELKTALENQNSTLNSYENTKSYKEITKDLNNAFSLIKQVSDTLKNNSKVSLTSLNNQMSNANEALNTLVAQIQNSIDSSLSNSNDNKENLKLLANTLSVIQNASKVVHQAQANVSQVATSSITYKEPTTQTQRTNSSAYGLDIQIGYKYFFGKKKHFGIRGYATYSYMYSSANTAISNKDNNLGKTNHHTYGAGFDFLYNFYESKNSLYTTGILLGVELLGSTWDNSNYALLNDYAKDIKALGGKAHLHTSAFQLPLVIGFRSNFSKHSGIELGFKIPLITNDYFTSNLKGYKETIIYRDNVNLYFNYVVNF